MPHRRGLNRQGPSPRWSQSSKLGAMRFSRFLTVTPWAFRSFSAASCLSSPFHFSPTPSPPPRGYPALPPIHLPHPHYAMLTIPHCMGVGTYLQERCPEVSQSSSATSTLPFRTCHNKHSLTSHEKKNNLAAQRKAKAHTCCECPNPKLCCR